MNSTRSFYISSQGLSDHEHALLQQQLKMLKGRTREHWSYIDQRQSAAVVIVRDSAQSDTARALVNQSPYAAKSIPLEWPLRLFGLLSLLEECEAQLPAVATTVGASLGALLAEVKTTSLLQHADYLIAITPNQDQVFVNTPNFSELVNTLVGTTTPPTVLAIESIPSELNTAYSLKRLLWSLSLREKPAKYCAPSGQNQEFRLGKWPLFNEWDSSPVLMRLAALYTRQHASIAQGVEFSHASAEEVAAFLRACERCDLGLDIRAVASTKVQRHQNNNSQNLFQRLRNRLGLGINKA